MNLYAYGVSPPKHITVSVFQGLTTIMYNLLTFIIDIITNPFALTDISTMFEELPIIHCTCRPSSGRSHEWSVSYIKNVFQTIFFKLSFCERGSNPPSWQTNANATGAEFQFRGEMDRTVETLFVLFPRYKR